MKVKKNIAISESGFVFDPTSGDSYMLNSVGFEILNLLKEGKDQKTIIQKLLEKYDVEKSVLERYFFDFLGLLKQYQLIEGDDES
jgi:PqqD family protein of HPr-rel-A system